MGNIKDVFKIILMIQLLTCVLAGYYGHPDAETIDFGSPTQPNRNQLIIEAAIKRGMDGDAVAELLRTRKPVVKTTTTPEGFTKTTTYKLEPDGSISSKSILQKRHRYVYNTHEVPDELRNSPSGTITRTFTDSDGSKVTQTIAVSKPKASTVLEPDDLTGDWFKKPFPSWPEESSPSGTVHRTITRTYSGPNGERRTVQSWPESPIHHVQPTYSNNRPNTRTYVKPETDPFDFDNDDNDDDGWEVVSDPEVETTTKKQFKTWTPKTWEWPEFPTHPTTSTPTTLTTTSTTTAKPKLYIEPEPPALKPLPSLEEFLKSQYGKPSESGPATTTHRTQTTTTSKTTTSTTNPDISSTTKVINIDDLPVVEVLHDGKPVNDSILKLLPPHLTPQAKMDPVLKVENKYPIDDEIEVYTPKVETNVRTFSKTHIGPEKPKLKDLDPEMQEILKKAGISPEDITDISGDTITKTRTEPDGRVITTTLKINTVPTEPKEHRVEPQPQTQQHHNQPQPQQHYVPSVAAFPHSYNPYRFSNSPSYASPSFNPVNLSPISEFLARLGLNRHDITSRNNRYTKTIIDENGDILTATFVLTTGRGSSRPKPYK